MYFNNINLFENKNKILLLKATLFANMYNLGQIRYLLQTPALTITYGIYPYNGTTYYAINIIYTDINNNQHSNLIALSNAIDPAGFYFPLFLEFDIHDDNTCNYFIGTYEPQYNLQYQTIIGMNSIVSINTFITPAAVITNSSYFIIGNTTVTRQDNIEKQSEIYLEYVHLLDL